MKIAIIGAGRLGSALGGRLAAAGHLITFAGASGTAREAAQRTPGSSAAGTTVAVSASELVVLAVPYAAIGEALGSSEEAARAAASSGVRRLRRNVERHA